MGKLILEKGSRGKGREEVEEMGGKEARQGASAADLQLVPLGMVEEASVGSGSLGLNRFEQVLSIVGQ